MKGPGPGQGRQHPALTSLALFKTTVEAHGYLPSWRTYHRTMASAAPARRAFGVNFRTKNDHAPTSSCVPA